MSICNAIEPRERRWEAMAQLCISCFRTIIVVTGVFYCLARAENCYSDQPGMEVLTDIPMSFAKDKMRVTP